jgi:hypothetical protein
MIYSALEKKKRTYFNAMENNPEITKYNEMNTVNTNHKSALTYATDASWSANGSFLPTSNFEKWTRLNVFRLLRNFIGVFSLKCFHSTTLSSVKSD